MFEKRKIRKLVKKMIQSSVIISAYPIVELHEDLQVVLGTDTIKTLMEKCFKDLAHDPIMLRTIKDTLGKRTDEFLYYVNRLIDRDNIITQCNDKECSKCGSALFKIGENYICRTCFEDVFKTVDFGECCDGTKDDCCNGGVPV